MTVDAVHCRLLVRKSGSHSSRQGTYAVTKVNGHLPPQADMQRHFAVAAPSVHQMALGLEHRGLLRRHAGRARSLEVLVAPETLLVLR